MARPIGQSTFIPNAQPVTLAEFYLGDTPEELPCWYEYTIVGWEIIVDPTTGEVGDVKPVTAEAVTSVWCLHHSALGREMWQFPYDVVCETGEAAAREARSMLRRLNEQRAEEALRHGARA